MNDEAIIVAYGWYPRRLCQYSFVFPFFGLNSAMLMVQFNLRQKT